MATAIEKLKELGCLDFEHTMERFLDDEEFYLSLLEPTLQDESFDALGNALESGDVTGAFEASHTLKGIVGNMGLTPLYEQLLPIVESLRAGKIDGLLPIYRQMMKEREKFLTVL